MQCVPRPFGKRHGAGTEDSESHTRSRWDRQDRQRPHQPSTTITQPTRVHHTIHHSHTHILCGKVRTAAASHNQRFCVCGTRRQMTYTNSYVAYAFMCACCVNGGVDMATKSSIHTIATTTTTTTLRYWPVTRHLPTNVHTDYERSYVAAWHCTLCC